jgi:DNA-binding transcriptional MerR regulator
MMYDLWVTAFPPRFSLTELANVAGVTPRTIRYYIAQGLLAAPGNPGPGPKYTDADLARLRLIKRLQREHLPLAEIRTRLDGLADDDVVAADAAPERARDSALDYIQRMTGRRVAETRAPLLMPAMYPPDPTSSIAPTVPAAPALEQPSEARLERSQWERIELAPDVELHVRRPLARQTARRVDRIISIARDLLEEEPT